jgi:hypothetical protein
MRALLRHSALDRPNKFLRRCAEHTLLAARMAQDGLVNVLDGHFVGFGSSFET